MNGCPLFCLAEGSNPTQGYRLSSVPYKESSAVSTM